MDKVEIRKTRNGHGVFTIKDFKPDDTIFRVIGKFIPWEDLPWPWEKSHKYTEEDCSNTFRFDEKMYISPNGYGDYLNHSCKPNAMVEKKDEKLFITTVNKINKGEEVVIDYSTIIALDDPWAMDCNCGDRQCRKVIGKFDLLPDTLKRNYISRGMVPDYILNLSRHD